MFFLVEKWVCFSQSFLRKNYQDLISMKKKIGKEKKSSKQLIVNNAEILSEKFFSFYFLPLFSEKFSKNLSADLVKKKDLYYKQKYFSISKFKFDNQKFFPERKKYFFLGNEPKTKNVCFPEIEREKIEIEPILKLLDFESGRNIKKNKKFFRNLENSKCLSGFQISTQKIESKNSEEFVDLFLNFKEKKNFSVKPEINFDGFDFSGSVIILNNNIFGRGIQAKTKFEIVKKFSDEKNLFISTTTEFISKKFFQKKIFLNHQKNSENAHSLKVSCLSKKKQIKSKHEIEVLSRKNDLNFKFLEKICCTSHNQFDLPEYSKIIFKAKKSLKSSNHISNNLKIYLNIKNSLGKFPGETRCNKFIFQTEFFHGNNSFFRDFFSANSFGKNLKKNIEYQNLFNNNFSKRSSLEFEKSFLSKNYNIFIFTEAFSHKSNLKIMTNIFFGFGFKIKKFFIFHFWVDKNGKNGLNFEF